MFIHHELNNYKKFFALWKNKNGSSPLELLPSGFFA